MNAAAAVLPLPSERESIAPASDGLRRSAIGPALERLAAIERFRLTAIRAAVRLEGGMYLSETARHILRSRCGVTIGAYSYGECFFPGVLPSGVTIGRYASIAPGVRVLLRNHPLERLSMHPFFYNPRLGFAERDTIPTGRLVIGHDAWIGERAIVTPGCSRIGIGAVVGAGSVVTRDVPDLAIVAGNPARVIRYRFEPEICERVLQSRWWEQPAAACAEHIAFMSLPIADCLSTHPLLNRRG